MTFVISKVPANVIAAEADRFDTTVLTTIIQASQLPLDEQAVARYCHWFVGRESWWLWSQGDRWLEQRGPEWAALLGDHLAEERLGWPLFSLHMTCKAGRHKNAPYYWTRHLAIDIDYRLGESAWLRSRYDLCVNALGIRPVVVSTPRDGLRLLYPLAEPVSVFGFSHAGRPKFPALIPSLLEAAGVPIRPGEVEIYPLPKHTLRLPLAQRTVQLDPETLKPLPHLPRHLAVSRLVASMEHVAEHAPIDAFALADKAGSSLGIRRTRKVKPAQHLLKAPANVMSTGAESGAGHRIDVDRLEYKGLYPGVHRNEAVMAIARRKMLGQGWDAERTVDYLMEWTAEKTNGLSSEAADMESTNGAATLAREYQRICGGIDRAMAEGKIVGRIMSPYHPIVASEAYWIFHATRTIDKPAERYRTEIFLFCLSGFAKDRGIQASGPARYANAVIVHAQVPAKVMERWPGCGGGRYKRRLSWACEQGFARMVLNYRHSQNPDLSRARSFEVDVELSGSPALDVGPTPLLDVAQRATETYGRKVHPRQVEHAIIAAQTFGGRLAEVYGPAAGSRIRGLVDLCVPPPAAVPCPAEAA